MGLPFESPWGPLQKPFDGGKTLLDSRQSLIGGRAGVFAPGRLSVVQEGGEHDQGFLGCLATAGVEVFPDDRVDGLQWRGGSDIGIQFREQCLDRGSQPLACPGEGEIQLRLGLPHEFLFPVRAFHGCNGSGEVSAVCPTCNGSRNMSCDVCEGRGALGRHAVVKASFQPRRLNVTLGLRQDVGDDKWQEKDLPDLPATDDLFPGGPSDVSGCAHFLSLQRATVEGPGVLEDGSINDLPERLMKTLRDGFGDLIAKAEGRIRRTGVAVLWHPYVCVVYRRRPEDAPKHLFVNYDGMVISHGALPANRRFWICNVLSAVAVLLGFALWSEYEPAPGFIAWGLGLVILVVGWCVPPRARKKSAQDFHDQEPNTQEQPVVSTPTLTGERDE